MLSIPVLSEDGKEQEKSRLNISLEIGIDEQERRYYSPSFQYNYSFKQAEVFFDITYNQIMDGNLKGPVDYWLTLGARREIKQNLELEVYLKHMCRHLTSIENRSIFNINEAVLRTWLKGDFFHFGLGYGTFTGGTSPYNNLLILNANVNNLFNLDINLKCEIKLVDFNTIFHEIECAFTLGDSIDLFIKNLTHYEMKNSTRIGIRLKSEGKINDFIYKVKNLFGVYPLYEHYKVLARGEIELEFFKTASRRVLFNLTFIAPILRKGEFLGSFHPAVMEYPISFCYERKFSDSFYIGWYSRYTLTMPMDKDQRFSGDLGTGVVVKNQQDFDLNQQKYKYRISAGYNFEHDLEISLACGMVFLRQKKLLIGADFTGLFNNKREKITLRLFSDIGRNVLLRPFIGIEHLSYGDTKLIFGFSLLNWFNQ